LLVVWLIGDAKNHFEVKQMKSCVAALAIAFFLALTASADVWAQRHSSGERLKIGLVLAGGGAKGAAHVGVIKVLAELDVPSD